MVHVSIRAPGLRCYRNIPIDEKLLVIVELKCQILSNLGVASVGIGFCVLKDRLHKT